MEKNVKKDIDIDICLYMYNCITLLYTWNKHSIVKQLYLNKNFKKNLRSLIFLHPLQHLLLFIFFIAILVGVNRWFWFAFF